MRGVHDTMKDYLMTGYPPPIRLPADATTLGPIADDVIKASIRHVSHVLPEEELTERDKKLIRDILEATRVRPGREIYVARFPVEVHAGCPNGLGVPMAAFTIGHTSATRSDETFVRQAATGVAGLMSERSVWFIYQFVRNHLSSSEAAWRVRCGGFDV